MKDWTIRQRVVGGFVLKVALMTLMAAVALRQLHDIDRTSDLLRIDSLPGLQLSSRIMVSALTRYGIAQEHVISVDDQLMGRLEGILAAQQVDQERLLDAYEKTALRVEDQRLLSSLRDALRAYEVVQSRALRLSRELRNAEAHALSGRELTPSFERAQQAAQALFAYNNQAAGRAVNDINGAVAAAERGVLLTGLVALALMIWHGVGMLRAVTTPLGRLVSAVEVMRTGDLSQRLKLPNRDEFAELSDGFNRMSDELGTLVGHIQRSGIQVNTSVTEIAATAKEQQATAAEIAATTTEIGATSREIAATGRELARTMKEVAGFAEDSASLAGRGQAGLGQMETTMARVSEATGTINAKLAVLSDKAANIGQVVTTINRVADQTNLLSLNAAIEAEKAGEYGRGFAVVATEIRRLADQTAVATADIEQMVREIQAAVSAGVMGMDRFSEEVRAGLSEVRQVGQQLAQIIQQVQALAPRCEAVSEGVQVQATGADQITQSLVQLSEAAQQTVDSLRQSTMAVGDLNQVASGLRTAIARFKVEA